MTPRLVIALFVVMAWQPAFTWESPVFAQERSRPAPADESVLYEDAAVRVAKVSVPPHQTAALRDYVNAVIITLPLEGPAAAEARKAAGRTALDEVKVSGLTLRTRTLENVADSARSVVIVAFKAEPAPPKAVVGAPISAPREGLSIRTLFDNESVTVDGYRLAPGYREAREHPHLWETIILHVAANNMEGAGAGKVARQVLPGDAAVIPANTNHAFANLAKEPAEFLYVRLK